MVFGSCVCSHVLQSPRCPFSMCFLALSRGVLHGFVFLSCDGNSFVNHLIESLNLTLYFRMNRGDLLVFESRFLFEDSEHA